MSKAFIPLLLLLLGGCAAQHETSEIKPALEFEDLGCTGDWPSDAPLQDTVTRQDSAGKAVFLVRHPATCGLSVRNPSFSIRGNALVLSYEMYSPQGTLLLCDCDFRSRFTFTNLPNGLEHVTFEQAGHER